MSTLFLENDALQVTISPDVGGTIRQVRHKDSGLSVLGRVPWAAVDEPLPGLSAKDESEWLTRYTGGWPLLFPNGGDACTVDGVFHGFHGEASIAPWEAKFVGAVLHLFRRFVTVPATMAREISLEDDVLVVRERLQMLGEEPVDVMWGHHPTFGSDLLDGAIEITAGRPRVTVDSGYDPEANPLVPGATGAWPLVKGKHGMADLAHPLGRIASLVYLHDFDDHWVAIRRMDNAIAATLSWDGARFPCAWLWHELEANGNEPWNGCTRLTGVEPNTTRSAMGIADAKQRGSGLLRMERGRDFQSELRLHVFRPSGPVTAALTGTAAAAGRQGPRR